VKKKQSSNIQECIFNYQRLLGQSIFQEDVEECFKAAKFNQKTRSRNVCLQLLISRKLELMSMEEKSNILKCIDSRGNGLNIVRECSEVPMDKASCKSEICISEKELLLQIKNKYCPETLYSSDKSRQDCIQAILSNNLNYLDLEDRDLQACETQTASLPKAIRESAIKKCQRLKLYEKLISKNSLEVAPCWDRTKYSSLKDQQSCDEDAKDFYEEIEKCKNNPTNLDVISCMENLEPKEFLGHNLEIIANKYGVSELESKCPTGMTSIEKCRVAVLYGNGSFDPMKDDPNSCASDSECFNSKLSSLNQTRSQNGVDDLFTSPLSFDESSSDGTLGIIGGSVGAAAMASNFLESSNASEVSEGLSAENELMASLSENQSDSSSGAAQVETKPDSGAHGLLEDFRRIRFIKHPDPNCKNIGRASLLRVSGTLLAGGIIAYGGSQVLKNFKNKKDKNYSAMKGLVILGQTTIGALMLKKAFYMKAKNLTARTCEDIAVEDLSNVSSSFSQYCDRKAPKTSELKLDDLLLNNLWISSAYAEQSPQQLLNNFTQMNQGQPQDIFSFSRKLTGVGKDISKEYNKEALSSGAMTKIIECNVLLGTVSKDLEINEDNLKAKVQQVKEIEKIASKLEKEQKND
jgi:hypothetical protein